jgi:hypothetical protein
MLFAFRSNTIITNEEAGSSAAVSTSVTSFAILRHSSKAGPRRNGGRKSARSKT